MTEFLYEKDLLGMQYNILVSTRHDRAVEEISRRYGLGKQRLRRLLIERLDMILLENVPARYEVWQRSGDAGDVVARSLGQELLTRYLPLIEAGVMRTITEETREKIRDGAPSEEAITWGRNRIREVLGP